MDGEKKDGGGEKKKKEKWTNEIVNANDVQKQFSQYHRSEASIHSSNNQFAANELHSEIIAIFRSFSRTKIYLFSIIISANSQFKQSFMFHVSRSALHVD